VIIRYCYRIGVAIDKFEVYLPLIIEGYGELFLVKSLPEFRPAGGIFRFQQLIWPIDDCQGIQHAYHFGISKRIPNKPFIRKRFGWEPEREV